MQIPTPEFDTALEIQYLTDFIVATWENAEPASVMSVVKTSFEAGWKMAEFDSHANISDTVDRRAEYLQTIGINADIIENDKLLILLQQLASTGLYHRVNHIDAAGKPVKFDFYETTKLMARQMVQVDEGLARMGPKGFYSFVDEDQDFGRLPPYAGGHDALLKATRLDRGMVADLPRVTSMHNVVKSYYNERRMALATFVGAVYGHAMQVRKQVNTRQVEQAVMMIDVTQPWCAKHQDVQLPDDPVLKALLSAAQHYYSEVGQAVEEAGWQDKQAQILQDRHAELIELDDYQWKIDFENGDDAQRAEVAMRWCQVFQAKTGELSQTNKLKEAALHHRWMRDIQPYINKDTMGSHSPFAVFKHFVKRQGSTIKKTLWQPLVESVEAMWFGEQKDREFALRGLGKIIQKIQTQHSKLPHGPANMIHELAWDIVGAVEEPHPLATATAIQLSTLHAFHDYPLTETMQDPRGIAWYAIAQAMKHRMSVVPRFRSVDALETVRGMHPVAAADGIFKLVEKTTSPIGNGMRAFITPSVLGPNSRAIPTVYEVLRHWIPARMGLWDSSEALELAPRVAMAQLYGELKPKSTVDLTLLNDMNVDF